MAEALNYRMNLVIDPKNVIKANRELRAMERYFERIQGRVLKIGRTRMAPEIVLNDMASKGLDNLLNKINRVKSQIINASGNVDLKVKSSSSVSIEGVDSLVKALNSNTSAIKLKALFKEDKPKPEEEKKLPAWAEKLQKAYEPVKVVQDVYKGVTGEDLSLQTFKKMPAAFMETKQTWKEGGAKGVLKKFFFPDKKEEAAEGNAEGASGNKDLSEIKELIKKLIQVTSDRSTGGGFGGGNGPGRRGRRSGGRRSGSRGGGRRSSGGQRDFNSRAGDIARNNTRDQSSTRGNRSGRQSIAGSAESNPRINPNRRVPSPRNNPRNSPRNSRGRRSSKSSGVLGIVGGLLTGETDIDASSVLDMVKDSGLVEKVSKGLGVSKKLISGPLGVLADAASIATSAPGKERAQAIGSTVGGAVGSSVGGAIGTFLLPGVGTAVGSYVGGLAGDFLGGKVGGWISDHGSEIKEKASKVTGWLSDQTKAFGDSISNFFSFGGDDKPKKEVKPPAVPKPAVPPQPVVAVAAKPLPPMPPFPGTPAVYGPMQPGAKGVPNPYGPMAIANQGVNPSPLLNTAAYANNGAKAKGKANGNPTPQVVQISPEQMGTLSGFLKDFKTETTNQFNLPAGAVQVTVHENKLDVDGLITQIGYRLKAEILRATQNTKPAGAGVV
ncbi:hypothetical protein P4H61_01700 [Paenibacillus peoriae]|uniref:hypothetical protein n=1 Tax=Paenibacillus peoriae TaxID=59893 RepID=UPI00026C5FAE|nr:hypothetical protein [Paenibacillus peoriae]MEC0180213.1 hypothetical protein [Paenibacillus peoriae]